MFQSLLDFGRRLVRGKFAASLYATACIYFFVRPSWEVCVFVAVTCAPYLLQTFYEARNNSAHTLQRVDALEEKVIRLVNRVGK